MDSMIYYPDFELRNENVTKFALLYFDELRPIIPSLIHDESFYLSETAKKIVDKTNLIRPYKPSQEEIECASMRACKQFDEYLRNPLKFSSIFGINLNDNFMVRLGSKLYRTHQLYNKKYTNYFLKYCLDNDIADEFDEGINVSKELAFIYMSFLADTISKVNNYEIFTDENEYDFLLSVNDQKLSRKYNVEYQLAKNNIEFFIPREISSISIDKIIELRSQPTFNEYRLAYSNEIKKLAELKQENINSSLEDLLKIKKDLIKIISAAVGGVAAVMLIASDVASLVEGDGNTATTLASIYLGYDISSYRDIRNSFINVKNKTKAKRYLLQIAQMIS